MNEEYNTQCKDYLVESRDIRRYVEMQKKELECEYESVKVHARFLNPYNWQVTLCDSTTKEYAYKGYPLFWEKKKGAIHRNINDHLWHGIGFKLQGKKKHVSF